MIATIVTGLVCLAAGFAAGYVVGGRRAASSKAAEQSPAKKDDLYPMW